MEQLKKVRSLVDGAEDDAEAFYNKSNKVAGKRLRATMRELKGLAAEIRKGVTEKKNAPK